MNRRRYMGGDLDDHTIVENYTKVISGWGAVPEKRPVNFDEDTEIYGHLEGSNRKITLGSKTSEFGFTTNTEVVIMGQWGFQGLNHYFFRTLWSKRKVFNWAEPMIFDFTISVKNGFHVWNEDKTIDYTLNDEESKKLIRSFVGNAVLQLAGRGKIDYIKTRKLKEN